MKNNHSHQNDCNFDHPSVRSLTLGFHNNKIFHIRTIFSTINGLLIFLCTKQNLKKYLVRPKYFYRCNIFKSVMTKIKDFVVIHIFIGKTNNFRSSHLSWFLLRATRKTLPSLRLHTESVLVNLLLFMKK
jgi:calcineurin-like phosphoesterase family protein